MSMMMKSTAEDATAAAPRVIESKPGGVQRLAGKPAQGVDERRGSPGRQAQASPIQRITDQRMTTIGGVALRALDRLPQAGDEVTIEGVVLRVLEMKGHRIARLRASKGSDLAGGEEVGEATIGITDTGEPD